MGIHASRIRLIAHRRNTHWMVDTPGRRVVLRRYAADRSHDDVAYELRLLERLHSRGWPVPTPVAPLVEAGSSIWCVFRYMPGRAPMPRSAAGVRAEQRRRGRLLAQLHTDMADAVEMGQRERWRRADEGLFDRTGKPPVDETLAQYEREAPEEGRVLRAYAERMRERLGVLLPYAPAPIVIHGDFTPWNIRYTRGSLSGVLDFDAAHLDLRVADFALTWRGRYDDVVRGYEEVSPLEPVEQELLVPIYWAWIIGSVVAGIDAGRTSDGWAVEHLLRTEHVRAASGASSPHPATATGVSRL
jgi:Ser/Thr protein kinase RdoA (MazF antagonist)